MYLDYSMNLVYNWYDDRYQSKVLFDSPHNHAHYLKVKVTNLEL